MQQMEAASWYIPGHALDNCDQQLERPRSGKAHFRYRPQADVSTAEEGVIQFGLRSKPHSRPCALVRKELSDGVG